MPFGIQPWHLIVVLIVALVIFGPSRLPQLGRSMGSFFRDLRAGARDMSNGFKESMQDADSAKAAAAQPSAQAKGPIEAATTSAPSVDTKPQATVAAAPHTGNFCTSCGAPNAPEARFCNACGKQLKD
jgi:sec-independent protein translocase protein TatA